MKSCSDTPREVRELAEYCCASCHENSGGHETDYVEYNGQTYELCHPYQEAVKKIEESTKNLNAEQRERFWKYLQENPHIRATSPPRIEGDRVVFDAKVDTTQHGS